MTGLVIMTTIMFGSIALSRAAGVGEQMQPRTIDRNLPVVASNLCEAVVIFPSIENGRALAERIQKAVQDRTGVSPALMADREAIAVVPAWPDETLRRRPLILIGNISVNRALIPLYGNFLAAEDLRYPGGDGYTLRTVVSPYGTGCNAIVLGGSTEAGMRRAVEAFIDLVGQYGQSNTLSLPGLLTVVPGGEYTNLVAAAARPVSGSGTLAFDYLWTAQPAQLELALKQLRAADFMKPETAAYNPGHYGKEMEVRKLMALIQTGALTTNEILHLDNILLQGLHEEYNGYWIVHDGATAGTRHQTMGMMGFLVTANYLLNHAKPNDAARAFLARCVQEGHAFFRQFETHYRDESNDNGSFDSNGPICRYMMAFGNTAFFTNGMARLMARRALMMIDNRGWFVAAGNYEDVRQGSMTGGVATDYALNIPAFVYGDASLKWIMGNVPGFGPISGYAWGFASGLAGGRYPLDNLAAVYPGAEWAGAVYAPLLPYYYDICGDYMTHSSSAHPHPWAPLVPRDKAVEMLGFRDRFEPSGQFLFMMGFQGGRYNSMNANAILRYMDRGHLWLIDQTEQFGPYFRNALHIGTETNREYLAMPGAIRLDAWGAFDDAALSATTLPAMNRADWTRHIFWARGRYFLALDTATFLDDGAYDLTCTWQTLPPAALEKGAWVARFMDSRFELHNADGIEQVASFSRARATEQMCVHPYTLRQHRSVQATRGQRTNFRNLFFTQPAGDEASAYSIRPVGEDAVMISDGRGYLALAGIVMQGQTNYGALATDARMFLISTNSIRLAPETARLSLNGKPCPADRPAGEALKSALADLWNQVSPAKTWAPPRESRSWLSGLLKSRDRGVGTKKWTYQPERLFQQIGGVNIVDPICPQSPDTLFDRQSGLWFAPYPWPTGTTHVTFDLGRVEDIGAIELHVGNTALNSGQPADWRIPGTPSNALTLAFSDDRFARDNREKLFVPDTVCRQTPPAVYKPYEFLAKYWLRIGPQGADRSMMKARYVRVPVTAFGETAFYRAATRPAEIDWMLAADLDGDGNDELVVATEAAELIVLNSDGSLRWKKTLANTITALLAADLTDAGRPTLYVADNGWDIVGFDADSREVWRTACRTAGSGIPGVFAMGNVLPKGATRRLLVVATGRGVACLDPDGKLYGYVHAPGIASDSVLAGHSSAPAARHRTAGRDAWGGGACGDVVWEEGAFNNDLQKKRMMGGVGLSAFWWLGLGFEFWPETSAPESWKDGLAVFIARAGLNAYNFGAVTSAPAWSVTANGPISSYLFADMDGKPGQELVVGRLDGFINIYDRAGAMISAWPTRSPVKALCEWPDGDGVFAAALAEAVVFYSRDGKMVGRIPVAAERLAVVKTGGRRLLICAGRDGIVTGWGIQPTMP